MRKPEVSPLVSIRDGIQVVAEVPRHAMKRPGWNGKSSGMMRCFASKGGSLQA